MSDLEFKPWSKIPRSSGEKVVITEKMDGTNACIVIQGGSVVAVQSRNRFITELDDNYGFASWVVRNKGELTKLGEGHHYGEWVGPGIQKNPHNLEERAFYLFNTSRWNDKNPNKPNCCQVVPVLYFGEIDKDLVGSVMHSLDLKAKEEGYTPEGVITFFCKSQRYEKSTYKFSKGKWCS